MLKSSQVVFSILGALALSLALPTGTAEAARRAPGWAGIPDPPSSGNCWNISASKLFLASVAGCNDDAPRYFQLPLLIDNTSGASLTATWNQGTSGNPLTFGTVCARVAVILQDGTVASAPAFKCGLGVKSQSFSLGATSSAMMTVSMQTSQGIANVFLSSLMYTP